MRFLLGFWEKFPWALHARLQLAASHLPRLISIVLPGNVWSPRRPTLDGLSGIDALEVPSEWGLSETIIFSLATESRLPLLSLCTYAKRFQQQFQRATLTHRFFLGLKGHGRMQACQSQAKVGFLLNPSSLLSFRGEMSLDGLAELIHKSTEHGALREKLLRHDSLITWPSTRLKGVCKNVDSQRLNMSLLKVVADHWCPQWNSPAMIPINDAKAEASK